MHMSVDTAAWESGKRQYCTWKGNILLIMAVTSAAEFDEVCSYIWLTLSNDERRRRIPVMHVNEVITRDAVPQDDWFLSWSFRTHTLNAPSLILHSWSIACSMSRPVYMIHDTIFWEDGERQRDIQNFHPLILQQSSIWNDELIYYIGAWDESSAELWGAVVRAIWHHMTVQWRHVIHHWLHNFHAQFYGNRYVSRHSAQCRAF